MIGVIKVFNRTRAYGFIGVENSEDVFFHITEIQDGIEPMIGTRVSFETEETPKGFSAKNVKILE